MPNSSESVLRNPESNHTVFLITVVRRLWKRRIFLLVSTVLFIGIGIVVSLLTPISYFAQTIIIPPVGERSVGLSIGKDLPFDLASSLFGNGNTDKDQAERFVGILETERLRLCVIDSFKLAERYGFAGKNKKYFIEDVIAAFEKKSLAYSSKGSVIVYTIDKSPVIAAAMANYMVCVLDSINKEMIRTQMGHKKEFMYQRMIENRDSLAVYENMLMAFQKEHGIIDLPRQAEASVSVVAQTEVDMMLKELQLSQDEAKFSSGMASLSERMSDMRALRQKLMAIDKSKGRSLLLPIQKIPDEALTLSRLQRAITVTDLLDRFLTKSYEEARLEEKNSVPTIAVLDPARVPQKRFQPKRRKIVLFFLALGIGLGVIVAVAIDSLEPYRKAFTAAPEA